MAKRIFAKMHTIQNINIYSKTQFKNLNAMGTIQIHLNTSYYTCFPQLKHLPNFIFSLPKHIIFSPKTPTKIHIFSYKMPTKTNVLARKSMYFVTCFSRRKTWVIGNLDVYFGCNSYTLCFYLHTPQCEALSQITLKVVASPDFSPTCLLIGKACSNNSYALVGCPILL